MKGEGRAVVDGSMRAVVAAAAGDDVDEEDHL